MRDLQVSPVLTAHPTEVRRRSVVARPFEIARLLGLRRHALPPDLDQRLRDRGEDDARLRLGLHQTVSGIAAARRSTG